MKTSWLFSIIVLLSFSCFSQTGGVKLYGFSQPVLGGLPPTYETDEEGKKVGPKSNPRKNLFIYFSYPQNLNLPLVEIWMQGTLYKAQQVGVKNPVKVYYYTGEHATDSTTLVPRTTDTVIQLILEERVNPKTTVIKKSIADSNDLIIVYRLNGKLQTQMLKKIKGLRSAAMQ